MKKKQLKTAPAKKDLQKPVSQPLKKANEKRFSNLVALSVIIILGIIIYSNSFDCSFHFDDIPNIVTNKNIQNISDMGALWSGSNRFVAYFSFALNYHFGGLNVWGYHFVNLVIHLINACLVYWLTLLIFASPAIKENPLEKHKKAIAFFTALLFVSHPLATQSVTYIVQRMASLVTLFYLLSLLCYVKARLTHGINLEKYGLFACSLVSAVLAMFTKENAFTLPFAIVLFEIFFLQAKKLSINFRDRRIALLAASFLILIMVIALRFSFSIFKPLPPSLRNDFTITPLHYLFTQFSVIIKYIQLLFIPVNLNLDYDYPLSTNFFDARTVLSFLLLAALLVTGILLFKKYRIISFGIFWFFLTLSIESSIVPINDLIFEHRTYLPSVGFFLILSTGIVFLLWNKYKYWAVALLLVITLTNSILTYQRNKVWADDLTLLTDINAKSPGKPRPKVNLGSVYMDLGQWDKAILQFSKAIEINPTYFDAFNNRGAAYTKLGQWDKAMNDYSKALEIDPRYTEAYYNRGITYGNLGQWEKAIADYTKAIGFNPKLVTLYTNRGAAYIKTSQQDKALADFLKAIEIDPNNPFAYENLGYLYNNLGAWNKSIDIYTKLTGIDPGNANAYFNRGIAYGNLNQWDRALADFSKALEINPNDRNAYTNREVAKKELNNRKN